MDSGSKIWIYFILLLATDQSLSLEGPKRYKYAPEEYSWEIDSFLSNLLHE